MGVAVRRRVGLAAGLVLLLAGCGDSYEGPSQAASPGTEGPNTGVGRAWVSSPSQMGSYQTDRTSVRLKGGSFTPPGASCPGAVGVLPPGFTVTWANALNGRNGGAVPSLNCLVYTITAWDTVTAVPLDVGANTIQVTADDGAGNVGRDRIVVTRVPDTTPPTVVQASPADGSTGVSRLMVADLRFSEPMDPATLTAASVTLAEGSGASVPATVAYDGSLFMATVTPAAPLAPTTTYRVTVTTVARDDPGGNPLQAPFVCSFTTGP